MRLLPQPRKLQPGSAHLEEAVGCLSGLIGLPQAYALVPGRQVWDVGSVDWESVGHAGLAGSACGRHRQSFVIAMSLTGGLLLLLTTGTLSLHARTGSKLSLRLRCPQITLMGLGTLLHRQASI